MLEDASARLIIRDKETVLFRPQKSDQEILWDGAAISDSEIQRISGIDQILPCNEFDKYLATYLTSNTSQIYAELNNNFDDKSLLGILKDLKVPIKGFNKEMDSLRYSFYYH